MNEGISDVDYLQAFAITQSEPIRSRLLFIKDRLAFEQAVMAGDQTLITGLSADTADLLTKLARAESAAIKASNAAGDERIANNKLRADVSEALALYEGVVAELDHYRAINQTLRTIKEATQEQHERLMNSLGECGAEIVRLRAQLAASQESFTQMHRQVVEANLQLESARDAGLERKERDDTEVAP